jgi:hypothetical protein
MSTDTYVEVFEDYRGDGKSWLRFRLVSDHEIVAHVEVAAQVKGHPAFGLADLQRAVEQLREAQDELAEVIDP